MAARDEVVPEDLLEHLAKQIPGFARESRETQMGLAWMLWNSTAWRRRHDRYPGYFVFTHNELDAVFGRAGLKAVNDRLQIFEITHWSHAKGYAKGYRLQPSADAAWRAYLEKSQRANKEKIRLLYGPGYELKSLPDAVASKDMDGITSRAWSRAKTLGLNAVTVDMEALKGLQAWLKRYRKRVLVGHLQGGLFSDGGTLEQIDYLLHYIAQILRLTNTAVAGPGRIMHRYIEAASGRLYAKGINLQTAPKVVKESALAGLWEYDFSNCHYSILTQMAARYGYQCSAIEHYLDNKRATRRQIAEAVGITEDKTKTCLLAILYGARQSARPQDAIPEAIGLEAASRLYAVPQFAALKTDIANARRAILKGHPRNRKGWITNLMGKSIGGKQAPEKVLAHLIQGVEARALNTAIESQGGSIVLLQHDGFATTTQLDVKAIEDAVEKTTGYRLTLEAEQIQPDPDAYFKRSNIPKRQIDETPLKTVS